MKILQISSVPITYPGGTEKVILELSKELAKKNKVTILQTTLYEKGKKFKREEEIHKIKIITCKNDFFLGGYGYSKEFKKTLKKIWKDYDVIHVHGHGRFTSNFTLRCIGEKKPLIYTAHGFFHDKKYWIIKKVHDLILGRLLKKARFCTALTKLDFKNYKKLGVKKEKIVEIPNGINKDFFKKINKQELKNFKTKYKIKENTILYVGRIHESKGLQYVIEAIKDIDARLVIVGKDAGYKKELEKLIKKYGLNKRVLFVGPLTDKELINVYHASNFFVLFSEWEGFGIVVIEAMAAGKPVIVSDRGSLPFLVKNEKNGYVVPFKNIKLLEEKIKFLLNNKDKARKIGEKGYKVAKNYSWKSVVDKMEKIYKKFTKNGI